MDDRRQAKLLAAVCIVAAAAVLVGMIVVSLLR
jgi:hypothetical protein